MGFLSKAKESQKMHRCTFQYISYISIVFLWEKKFGRSTAYSCRNPSASFKFVGFFYENRVISNGYPSSTQSLPSKNYSICRYNPLALSSI